MAAQNPNQKFFEIIHPGANYEFIGNQKYWIRMSIFLVLVTIVMLPINAFVLKDRGHMLNWGVDFRGGSEIVVQFSRQVDAGDVRKALGDIQLNDADVVKYEDPSGKKAWTFMIRAGAVSAISEPQAKQLKEAIAKVGDASLKHFEWNE